MGRTPKFRGKNCISEKTGESRTVNTEEKRRHFWKKFVGGHQIAPGTNFQHTIRKYLPDPPPCYECN